MNYGVYVDYGDTKMLILIAAAGILIGLSIAVWHATQGNRKYKKFQKPKKTVGTVTRVESDRSGGDYPSITYTFYYTFQDEWGRACQGRYPSASKELYQAGDSIPLYYDAAEPQKNIAEEHLKYAKTAYWKLPLIFAFVIVLIVGGSFVLSLLVP